MLLPAAHDGLRPAGRDASAADGAGAAGAQSAAAEDADAAGARVQLSRPAVQQHQLPQGELGLCLDPCAPRGLHSFAGCKLCTSHLIACSACLPSLDLPAVLNWPGLLVCCAGISLLQVRQLFQHAVGCQQKVTGGCGLCKKMWCLLNLHAKSCTTTNCPVPRCRCDMLDSAVACSELRHPACVLIKQRPAARVLCTVPGSLQARVLTVWCASCCLSCAVQGAQGAAPPPAGSDGDQAACCVRKHDPRPEVRELLAAAAAACGALQLAASHAVLPVVLSSTWQPAHMRLAWCWCVRRLRVCLDMYSV